MRRLVTATRTHPLAAYVLLGYTLSWAYWVPLAVTGHVVRLGGGISQFPGLLGPAVSAFVVTGIVDGRAGTRVLLSRVLRWRVPLRWWLFAVASPLALAALAVAAQSLTGGSVQLAGFGRMAGLPQWGGLFVWLMLILGALSEETGWRGFLYPRLRRDRGWLRTSLLIVPIWATWHLPLFWLLQSYRDLGPVGVPGFVLGLACGSILLGWLFESAGYSVLIVAVWHGTFNLTTATDAANGAVAAFVSTGVSVAAIALVVMHRRILRSPGGSTEPRPGRWAALRTTGHNEPHDHQGVPARRP